MPKKCGGSGSAAAVKRFLKQTIKWTDFDKVVVPSERSKFLAFKAKSESYLRRVQANPEKPPQINWDEYRKAIPDKGIVDKMQSAYEAFKVPYPNDTLTVEVDKQWAELIPKLQSFCGQQQEIINGAKKEIQRINDLPPFECTTMEMFHDLYPDQALKPVAKPTFWPHTKEEQLGYVDPTAEKH